MKPHPRDSEEVLCCGQAGVYIDPRNGDTILTHAPNPEARHVISGERLLEAQGRDGLDDLVDEIQQWFKIVHERLHGSV